MTKNYTLLVLIALMFVSCTSTKRLIMRGNYDEAIRISVKRIHKKSSNEKEIESLEKAYRIANQNNNDRIELLKTSRQPDVWDEIYSLYNIMNQRQDLVKSLPAEVLKRIGVIDIDYDKEIVNAKHKAADYYYAHGKQLLNTNDKFDAREAYEDFVRVKELYPSYQNIETLIDEAYRKGLSFAQFKVTNIFNIPLPKPLQTEFDKISLADLDQFWVKFQTGDKPKGYYDYKVHLMVKYFNAGNGKEETNTYTETKEIEDGWQYVYDRNGKVKKDSLGNDIKTPKYKTITCQVIETHQTKAASITADLEIYEESVKRLLKTVPIVGESIFENHYAKALGDKNALSDESLKKIGGKALPFPTDMELLLQAFAILKQTSIQAINDNQYLIK